MPLFGYLGAFPVLWDLPMRDSLRYVGRVSSWWSMSGGSGGPTLRERLWPQLKWSCVSFKRRGPARTEKCSQVELRSKLGAGKW